MPSGDEAHWPCDIEIPVIKGDLHAVVQVQIKRQGLEVELDLWLDLGVDCPAAAPRLARCDVCVARDVSVHLRQHMMTTSQLLDCWAPSLLQTVMNSSTVIWLWG